MNNSRDPEISDVLILCGGLGTRLQNVLKDKPKPMVDFNDRPFLDLLIEYVKGFGFKRFILCSGYKGNLIQEYYKHKKDGNTYIISQESAPLGTAGAIKNAESEIISDNFLAMNGDSFCPVDLNSFSNFHHSKNALVSLALTPMENTGDYGGVTLGDKNEINSFDEKTKTPDSKWVNAGIYFFRKNMLKCIPAGEKVSLELDTFPSLTGKGLFGFTTQSKLLDIGTPERLERARKLFIDLK